MSISLNPSPSDENAIVPISGNGSHIPPNETFNYSEYRRNKGNHTGFGDFDEQYSGYSGRLDNTTLVRYDKGHAYTADSSPVSARPPRRGNLDVADNVPFRRGLSRRKELRSLMRRESIHNQIDKVSKENVATDAVHSYERYAEKPFYFISNRLYSAYKRSLESKTQTFGEGKPFGDSHRATGDIVNATGRPRSNGRYLTSNRQLSLPKAQAFGNEQHFSTAYRFANRAKLAKGKIQAKIAQSGGKTVTGLIGNAVKSLVVKNPAVFAVAGGLFLILMMCNMLSGTVITVITSFTADEATASGVVEYIQQLDANLASEIESIPDGYTDIDEVNMSFSGIIATNPTHIMAYLTVKYSDFTLDQVRDDLNDIHKTLYTVEQEVETQIKQRTETDTYTDPITGEEFSEEREVEYEYNILHITVTCRQFSDYAAELIDADDMDWYELLVETGGNMMLGGNLGNPFVGVDWRSFVTTPYGYRINPVDQRREFHPAIDISWGGINGTPINAVHDGEVIQAVHGDATYGNYIMLEDASQNLRTRYSHCDSLLVDVGQEIKRGDEVGLVGSTGKSTGSHLDIEVYRDGRTVNPITELGFN